ncbi:hypothetical protein JVU11DRAFT_11634 [Chiua virens]|nr:hypothetical protein JVU11DRAFT_11634 [Chiua virens]
MSQWNFVTELLMFDTLEAFRRDPSVCEPGCQLVMTADGSHEPHYYGKRIEDAGKGNIICDWDSYEAHEEVLNGPLFPKVRDALLKETVVSWETTETLHAILSGSPKVALEHPVTAVTLLTLKAPENRNAVVDILTKISERTGNRHVFGVIHEDDQKYMTFCGWESVEAHLEAISKPEAAAILEKLWSLAHKDQNFHTHLFYVYRTT